MSAERPTEIDETLWSLILRYKQYLTDDDYPPVADREADRQALAERYPDMASLRLKLLDVKAYQQLGRVQEKVNKTLLAGDTTPRERLGMLARVVRMLTTPVMFVGGKTTIAMGRFAPAGGLNRVDDLDARKMAPRTKRKVRVRTKTLEDAERLALQRRVAERVAGGADRAELAAEMSFDEADLLSQLASRNDRRLVCSKKTLKLIEVDPDSVSEKEERLAVVLKAGGGLDD